MRLPTWFLDEHRHAGPEHLDPAYVPTYDHKAGTDPAAEVALVQQWGLAPAHTLVDLGAGTGAFARAVAPFCHRVVAVDISPVMRESNVPTAGVVVVEGGFLSYEHTGEPADMVYTRHALHHLPDLWKGIALRRMAALLRPGGVLVLRDLIFSCGLKELDSVIERWLDSASPTPARGWTRAELETHLREEYSTFSWLLEPMLAQAGFTIEHTEHDPSRVRSLYICRRKRGAETP